MSDPLIWLCIKDGNSFLRKKGNTAKRGGVMQFSAEPGNLTGLNAFKWSGIANAKAIGFSSVDCETAGKKDTKITMSLKTKKNKNKPAKNVAKVPLRFKSYKGAEKCIASQTVDNHYRSDLIRAATKKWNVLNNARRVKEGVRTELKSGPRSSK